MRIFWIFTGICLKVMSEKKKYLNIKSADHGFLLNKIENKGNMTEKVLKAVIFPVLFIVVKENKRG